MIKTQWSSRSKDSVNRAFAVKERRQRLERNSALENPSQSHRTPQRMPFVHELAGDVLWSASSHSLRLITYIHKPEKTLYRGVTCPLLPALCQGNERKNMRKARMAMAGIKHARTSRLRSPPTSVHQLSIRLTTIQRQLRGPISSLVLQLPLHKPLYR